MNADDNLIQVRDPAGISMPFSTGIMATSILATGLETPRAFGIAADIRRRLLSEDRRELTVTALASIAADTVAAIAGEDVARRYVSWRKAKRGGRPIVLCLSGTSGVGKSTLATQLALRLGIHRVVPTDAIRETLRTVIPSSVLPELHVSTHENLASGGGIGSSIFLRQAHAVGGAIASIARQLIRERRSVIFEGAHLVPGEMTRLLQGNGSRPIVVERLLVLSDEDHHRAHLARRARTEPDRHGQSHVHHLDEIREQQEELRRMARDARIREHDLLGEDDLTRSIVNEVVTQAAYTVVEEAPQTDAAAACG